MYRPENRHINLLDFEIVEQLFWDEIVEANVARYLLVDRRLMGGIDVEGFLAWWTVILN